MVRATAYSFVALAAALQMAFATPITPLDKRDGVACSSGIEFQSTISLVDYYNPGSTNQPIGLSSKTSGGGQVQLVVGYDSSNPLGIRARQCNSTHLNQFYSTNKSGPVKLFLENDESKCLVRHATLPSSKPTQKTHITIEDCSNVDDATQARQFWTYDTSDATARPIVLVNGNIRPLPLVLSSTNPQAVEATRKATGAAYVVQADFTD